MASKIGNKYKLKGTETRSDIVDKIGGSGGGSKYKLKKKKSKAEDTSPSSDRVTDSFMKEHGYTQTDFATKKPNTYTYLNDKGKIRAYTATSKAGKYKKEGVSQTTFKKPSLNQLKDWMGY